jgi:hypothetical protein
MGTIKKPVFPTVEELGNECFKEKVFKKIIRVTKKVSPVKMASVFKFTGMYNKKYGTNFFVKYERIGTSNTYELKNITCTKKPEETVKETDQGLVKGNQYVLFDPQTVMHMALPASKKISWMTAPDGDWPLGYPKET